MEITNTRGKQLLQIVRKIIQNKLDGKKYSLKIEDWMLEKMGVFVTIKKNGELRGCIGLPYPEKKLINAIESAAIGAAFEDPRFKPVEKNELKEIKIEISLLTPPEEIVSDPKDYPKKIKCGKDGLIVINGYNAGLLLPQVATEYGWDEKEFLSQTCWKAGLPPDAWLEKGTKVYKFQAIIFNEGK